MLSGYRPRTLLSRQLLAPENVLGSHLAFFSSYRTDQGHGRDAIYMFKPKATLNYSYEKSPESLRFGVSMPCAAIRTAKNAASPATCAKQFAPPSAPMRARVRPNSGRCDASRPLRDQLGPTSEPSRNRPSMRDVSRHDGDALGFRTDRCNGACTTMVAGQVPPTPRANHTSVPGEDTTPSLPPVVELITVARPLAEQASYGLYHCKPRHRT
jgi:hypothetical protein